MAKITFGNSVTNISGDWLCGNNGNLMEVSFGVGTTNINSTIFNKCTKISSFKVYAQVAPIVTGTMPYYGAAKPLHIPFTNSGYNVAPWTNTSIFSSIISDL